jgi:hypothetical protein
MSEAIVKYETGTIFDSGKMEEIKKYLAPTLNEQEFWMFMNTAKTLGLDPLKREIYAIKYGDKFSLITGYETYLKRANASKLLEWWKVTIEKPSDDFKTWIGKFTAKRIDWTQEFTWEVEMSECYKNQATWQTMKSFMLKKTTLAQGMRLLIPEIIGGLPHLAEEMGSQIIDSEYTDIPEEQKILPSVSESEAKDKAKNAFLEKLMIDLTAISSMDELEKKYTANKAKYEAPEMKESIIKLFGSRKRQLILELLSTKTGFSAYQVGEYMEQAGDIGTLVSECVAGNVEAINQLTAQMVEYLNTPVDREPGEEG